MIHDDEDLMLICLKDIFLRSLWITLYREVYRLLTGWILIVSSDHEHNYKENGCMYVCMYVRTYNDEVH
jgi:hypothetical protein